MQIRLNKFLAEAGICSRRAADIEILTGKVLVNNVVVRELGTKVNPEVDTIKYAGQEIAVGAQLVYFALYKPTGVVSSAKDDLGRKTVLEFVPQKPRVYPVGRLDYDSEGLIILTNDGEMTQRLTHPRFEHEKEYRVNCRNNRKIDLQKIKDAFISGIEIDHTLLKVDKIFVRTLDPYNIQLDVVLHEGRNRQIRRMCEQIGLKVTRLTRTRIGKLLLKELRLRPGEYKIINKFDILPPSS